LGLPCYRLSARWATSFGLKWEDILFDLGEIRPVRSIVDNHIGELKTVASGNAIPVDVDLASVLLDWRGCCPYNQNGDYVFDSPVMKGSQPYWPDTMLHKKIKPAAARAGITKVVGFASFRSTYATLLHAGGASVKVTQDLMRHANSKITLDAYAQSISADRRAAQARVTAGFKMGNN
jgi:integrase